MITPSIPIASAWSIRRSARSALSALSVLALIASAAISSPAGQAQPAAPAAPTWTPPEGDPADRGWPRQFETPDHVVTVFAPQVDAWPNFDRITFRAALSVGANGSDDRTFGILRVSASTHVAFEDRLVVLTDRKVEELSFPDLVPAEADRLKGIVMAAMPPEHPQTVSLDRLIAGLNPAALGVRKVDVSVEPPPVFFSDKPAVLVIFIGEPRFKPVPGSDLFFAVNTNWDVFMDPAQQQYYMLDGSSWLVTADLSKGPWAPATSLPASLSNLPADENWSDVRAAIPGVPATDVPVVFVSHKPAELIVTAGAPDFKMIPGTKLTVITNTESHLFNDPFEQQYYFLAAGRWFKSTTLDGPWSAASGSLPADFKKLPADAEFADVLAAVPGTPAASDAAIMASIPQKATINRNDVTLNVTYQGEPAFVPIPTTAVQYATNSPFSVFMVDGSYYCCHNAVWFKAPSPTGAWAVCTAVPPAIYTIPPSSPVYNVTYVQVYESTPTTVVTGYTAGYSGATVAATGVVMFGLGLAVGAALNDDYHYNSCFYSYGSGAVYHGGYGGYVCGSTTNGPYGGAGHAAAYNPATGVYSRGGYAYGPNGAAGYRTAYNPATGTSAARAGGVSPYGSWGSSAVTNGDKWATASHQTTARGTTAQVQTSSGAAAATAQGRYGNGATVAKSSSGDYYAAKDGNVYKNTGSGWEQAGNSAAAKSSPSQASSSTSRELQQQSAARSQGEQSAQRTSQYQSSGGARSAPSRGGGGRRR